jgi:type VI secretion system protein
MAQHALTLLERLADPGRIAARTVRVDSDSLLASIAYNLERIFNTRVGSAQAQMDLGLPPPNELIPFWPESSATLQRAIELCLERYEPRLTHVRVAALPIDTERLSLRFRIAGRLRGFDEPVRFETALGQSGQVSCRSAT